MKKSLLAFISCLFLISMTVVLTVPIATTDTAPVQPMVEPTCC